MNLFKSLFFVYLLFIISSVSAYSSPDFVPLIERYSSSVVNISTKIGTSNKYNNNSKFNFRKFGNEFSPEAMSDLLRRLFEGDWQKQNFHFQRGRKSNSLGSGMIISKDGYILTNHHVVNNSSEIIVRLKDRREFSAKVIGSDKNTDVALIKIDASNLPIVKIGNSDDIKVGEWVFAIGSPFGFDLSASAGIISAKGRSVPGTSTTSYVPFIQTDVAINPGNSGGPLFNLKGEVVGVNSMIYSKSGGYMGLSFSIPINVAMNVVDQIRTTGKVTRGWLGVLIQPVTYSLGKSFGMKKPEGSLVVEVIPNSPAAASGLKVGDIILNFNNRPILLNSDLPPIVASMAINSSAPLEVLRNGRRKVLNVIIKAMPKYGADISSHNDSSFNKSSVTVDGLVLTPIPEDVRKRLKIYKGGAFVSKVNKYNSSIMDGDVIVKFNYKDVDDFLSLSKSISNLPKGVSVPIFIKRKSGLFFLAFEK